MEQISLMKPMTGDENKPGLLEYLEDIIGSNQFAQEIVEKDERYERLALKRQEKV